MDEDFTLGGSVVGVVVGVVVIVVADDDGIVFRLQCHHVDPFTDRLLVLGNVVEGDAGKMENIVGDLDCFARSKRHRNALLSETELPRYRSMFLKVFQEPSAECQLHE